MTRHPWRFLLPGMALCFSLSGGLLHGDILYFDIPDVVLTPPSQGSVSAGIDFLLDGSDDFLLTLDRALLPAGGGTVTTLNLGGTFPMASVFVAPDAGGPGVHHLSKFLAGEQIGTPQNDVRRRSGLAFSMEVPSGNYTGDWGPQTEIAFAGLAIDGFVGPNFGWARLGIDHGIDGTSTQITLFDFAVEGVAFRPIVAGAVPEPAGIIAWFTLPWLLWFVTLRSRR